MSKKAFRTMHDWFTTALFWEAMSERGLMICALLEAEALALRLAAPRGSKKRPRYSRFAPQARVLLAEIEARREASASLLASAPSPLFDRFDGVEGT